MAKMSVNSKIQILALRKTSRCGSHAGEPCGGRDRIDTHQSRKSPAYQCGLRAFGPAPCGHQCAGKPRRRMRRRVRARVLTSARTATRTFDLQLAIATLRL